MDSTPTTFLDRARSLNRTQGLRLSLVVGGAALLWWPFDAIVFDGRPEVVAAFARWRIGVIAVCLAGFVAIRLLRAKTALPIVVAGGLACCAIFGNAFARTGGLHTAWVHTSYFAAL